MTNELRTNPVNNKIVYREEQVWETEIQSFTDTSSYLFTHDSGFKEVTSFNHLEDLTKSIYERRPSPQLSKDQLDVQTRNISYSCVDRKDARATMHISEVFARSLEVSPELFREKTATEHVLLKNGYNNARFKTSDGTLVTLKTAIAGSGDRENESISMARKVAPYRKGKTTRQAPSYCYTGRPDSVHKALEQAKMIFFSELECETPKGLRQLSNGVYELTYVVNSLQSTSPLYGAVRLFRKMQAPEHLLLRQEQAAFEELRKNTYTFTRKPDPKDPQSEEIKYEVQLKPILFSRQTNLFANLEKTLDSSLSGSKESLKVTQKGWKELKALAEDQLGALTPENSKLTRYLINRLEHSINGRWIGAQEDAVNELFCRALLVHVLQLPIVYHCKSSTDRTSIFVALHVALEQWLELGLEVSQEDPTLLISDARFKEFFAMNWVQGHHISRNARSSAGTFTIHEKTEEMEEEWITLFAGKGVDECPALARLLPERYLKFYGIKGFILEGTVKDKIKNGLLFFGIVFIGLLLTPFTTLLNPHGTLTTPDNFFASFLLGCLRYPVMLLKNYYQATVGFYQAIPTKTMDAEADCVDSRHLIRASKKQKSFLKPIKAVPSNAKNQEEYDQLFKQRFEQTYRPLRHTIQGNAHEVSNIVPAHEFLSKIVNAPHLDLVLTSFVQKTETNEKTIKYTCTHRLANYALIESTTTINNDPKSSDYGKGIVEYALCPNTTRADVSI